MKAPIKIVLFEDMERYREALLKALRKHIGARGVVILFGPETIREAPADKEKMYEDRLEKILSTDPYRGTCLIVADRDLSMSQDSYFGGLSVNAVAAASRRLYVPICSYARQPQTDDFAWRGRWEEGHIQLSWSAGEDELARQAVLAAEGFVAITLELPSIFDEGPKIPFPLILAKLLGKPEYAQKISLYSVGDQNRLSVVLSEANLKESRVQRMAHFLGYWLWDSLLRYPGLFVNEIAAASYLNIDTEDFRRTDIREMFTSALYTGPFSDSNSPQWWRGILDDIVSSMGFANGLELAKSRISPKINRSQCYVDPTKPAGYYCIISRQPVSLENSKGGLSWFPRGADLTRISNPKFDEYAAWLGS